YLVMHQCCSQQLHLFSKQGRTMELHHLQGAMYLMDVGQTEPDTRCIPWVFNIRLERLAGILECLTDFAQHPVEGCVITFISHAGVLYLYVFAGPGCEGIPARLRLKPASLQDE